VFGDLLMTMHCYVEHANHIFRVAHQTKLIAIFNDLYYVNQGGITILVVMGGVEPPTSAL